MNPSEQDQEQAQQTIFWTCETHGKYPVVMWVDGKAVSFPGRCPTCHRESQVSSLIRAASIPERFRDCDFDSYLIEHDGQQAALARCQEYAEAFADKLADGACMVLRGQRGTGKNHLATAIAKRIMGKGYTCLRLKVQDFLDGYWGRNFAERPDWLMGFAEPDLLILDELGRTADTKGVKDALFRLLDVRYEAVKPVLLLTNLTRDEIIEHIGDAAFDRLTQGGGRLVNFEWDSYRRSAAR